MNRAKQQQHLAEAHRCARAASRSLQRAEASTIRVLTHHDVVAVFEEPTGPIPRLEEDDEVDPEAPTVAIERYKAG